MKGMPGLYDNMIESLALRIRDDNQDTVKDSAESWFSLNLDILLIFHWEHQEN